MKESYHGGVNWVCVEFECVYKNQTGLFLKHRVSLKQEKSYSNSVYWKTLKLMKQCHIPSLPEKHASFQRPSNAWMFSITHWQFYQKFNFTMQMSRSSLKLYRHFLQVIYHNVPFWRFIVSYQLKMKFIALLTWTE